MKNVQYYLDRFRVTEKQLDELICTALSRGGDYADLFFEYTVYQELLLRDGQVSSGGFHVDYGVGIRVLKGERTGYAYSESTEMSDMLAAAAAASYIAKASSDNGRKTYGRFQTSAKNDFYPVLDDWRNNDAGRFIPVLTELEKRIFSKDSLNVTAPLSPTPSEPFRHRDRKASAVCAMSTTGPAVSSRAVSGMPMNSRVTKP